MGYCRSLNSLLDFGMPAIQSLTEKITARRERNSEMRKILAVALIAACTTMSMLVDLIYPGSDIRASDVTGLGIFDGKDNKIAQNGKIGDCPYSVAEIEKARNKLIKYADELFNYPLSDDASFDLELALAEVNQIEAITGCEATIRIFANAKLKAQQAKNMQDYHLKMRKESNEAIMRMITPLGQ